MKNVLSIILFSVLLFTLSCAVEGVDIPLDENSTSLVEQLSNVTNTAGKLLQPPIWADCDLYSGLVVPATFKPESNPFDELYAMPDNTFKDGVPLISDSKPGDKDYNGGRWHLNVLKAGVDASKYADVCIDMDLDLDDFMSTDSYFECPLRRRKN